jgi:hypothetical protein
MADGSLRDHEEEVRRHIPEVMELNGPDGVRRHYRLVRVLERGRWLVRADEDGAEAHALVAPEGIGLFTEEGADAFLTHAGRSTGRRDRSTASTPPGGYILNPLWLVVLGAGAWGTWRLYESGVDWWWTALVATLGWFWAIGITHNFRHDPDRLPSITGPVGLLSGLGCVGFLVASFLVGS